MKRLIIWASVANANASDASAVPTTTMLSFKSFAKNLSRFQSIEKFMKDAAVGLRTDVSLADLASMLNAVRTNLVGEDDSELEATETAGPRVAG